MAALPERGLGRPMTGPTLPTNFPHGSIASSSLAHGCSFRRVATPEQRPSPKRRLVGPTSHRRVARPFRDAYGSRLLGCDPETAWDFHRSMWSAIVSRRNHHPPRRVANTNRIGCCEKTIHVPQVLPQAKELGTPSRPKRGPSRTILAWPLRHRPLPDDAGCIPLRRRIRARISARVRPRTGRIGSIGVRSIAPFMTEPTTPAAHA